MERICATKMKEDCAREWYTYDALCISFRDIPPRSKLVRRICIGIHDFGSYILDIEQDICSNNNGIPCCRTVLL